MRNKLLIIGLALILGIVVFGPSNALAESWAKVHIDKLGQAVDNSAGHFTDYLTPHVLEFKYLKFKDSVSNQILATAMCALSMDKDVTIRIMDDGRTIDIMWIDNQ